MFFGVCFPVFFTGCTTIENRRDLYSPQRVEGPYTRMLRDGIPDVSQQSVSVEGTGSGVSKNVID